MAFGLNEKPTECIIHSKHVQHFIVYISNLIDALV